MGPVGVPANQVHDFNPGFSPTDVFWTAPVAGETVRVEGATIVHKVEIDMLDQKDVINAVRRGPSVPARVSYEVRWSGATFSDVVRNAEQKFVISFVEGAATINWRGETADWLFVSDPTVESVYAASGSERNGVFFS